MPINETLDEDGQTETQVWQGAEGCFAAFGDFGGGTVKLQVSFDGGTTWIDVGSDVTFTENGMGNFALPSGVILRADLDGSTNPDLTVMIRRVRS